MKNKTENQLKALLVKPLAEPIVAEISNNLDTLQKLVGGTIQVLYPFQDEVGLICNDDGKLIGLDLNRALRTESGVVYDIIAGDFLIVALTEDDFGSLSDEQLEQYKEKFYHPEIFIRAGDEILAIPVM